MTPPEFGRSSTTHNHVLFYDRSKEYGLVFTIRMLGLGTWLVIADPDLVHKVYVT